MPRLQKVYKLPQRISDKMKVGLRRILANSNITSSAINEDYKVKSGHTNDEMAYTTARHDYNTYKPPMPTEQREKNVIHCSIIDNDDLMNDSNDK